MGPCPEKESEGQISKRHRKRRERVENRLCLLTLHAQKGRRESFREEESGASHGWAEI
jgi:hypothetical protein